MGISGILLIAAGMAISCAAEATARGKLGPNPLIGIRVGYVQHSPEAWRAGHQAARWPSHAAAGIFAVCGILVLTLNLSDDTAGGIIIGSCLASLAAISAAAVKANRAAKLVVVQNAEHSLTALGTRGPSQP